MGRGTVRALFAASVVMGALLVAGVATLVTLVARRALAPVADAADVPRAASNDWATLLDEPAGTRIASAAGPSEFLVVRLEGGGPDRVVLIDPRAGAVHGRVALAR